MNCYITSIEHMECSICFEALTATTGRVELSCNHNFHYRCISKWFNSQAKDKISENCPNCRHKASKYERLPSESLNESMEEDEIREISEPDWIEAAAKERARFKFNRLKAKMTRNALENYAATVINSAARGYWGREVARLVSYLNNRVNVLKTSIEVQEVQLIMTRKELVSSALRYKIIKSAATMSCIQWKVSIIRKIQALWRGYLVRKQLCQ